MVNLEWRKQVLKGFNDTFKSFPTDKSIAGLFEEQVLKTPDNIAAFADEQSITYNELNKKANQLANFLIAQGVKSNDAIALQVNRGFDMIVAMYATLKCGAMYVPIPLEYPQDRQLYMCTQSGVKYLLHNTGQRVESISTDIIAIDLHNIAYYKYNNENLKIKIDTRQLAYTIYTSGSTGLPKGVMIEHRSVVNLITWVNSEFNVGENDRLLFVTSIGFDLSVYDVLGMLASGGAIVIAQKEDLIDCDKITGLLQRFSITFWNSVPSTLDYLVNKLATTNSDYRQNSLRLIFLSGDWIPVTLPERVSTYFNNAKVISLGGATEGTVWSNYYCIEESTNEWRSIPYGKPIANNTFYILNDQLQPVVPGVIGELYIGGIGVARGYANDVVKTSHSFVTDVFTGQWGGRMYRTGDLGRMMPDGNMEFIGRMDSQVKIRGYRVELGEIESTIRQSKTVSNAVVLFPQDKKQLIAYLVPAKYYDRDTIIANLRKKLPDYMIPGKWIELDEMPLTENGKININALQAINTLEQAKRPFIAPASKIEKTIATVWQEVLKVEQVGMSDNFFDLGGQSLMAVELITEIEKKVGRELPVNILYKYPTIALLLSFLEQEHTDKKWKSLVAIKPSGHKVPIYIVHGDGLSISNFQNLADHLDADQPVYSLQPIGLTGVDLSFETIADIAKHYLDEILEYNPSGPYALGGYSFGGYVAIEMKNQLEAMGKKVKILALFDTNAENVAYNKSLAAALPRRLKRQLPKLSFIVRSIFAHPGATIKYQYTLLSQKVNNVCYQLGVKSKPELKGINKHISKINETHLKALYSYELKPFDRVYLFKAKQRLYFVDDFKYLGWSKYAREGVVVYDIPGDHRTIFNPPNVYELAKSLQHALDHC